MALSNWMGHRTRYGTVTRWECDLVWRTGRGFIYVLIPNGQKALLTTYPQQKTLVKRKEITFYKKVIVEL
jgi:hypothetical protein